MNKQTVLSLLQVSCSRVNRETEMCSGAIGAQQQIFLHDPQEVEPIMTPIYDL